VAPAGLTQGTFRTGGREARLSQGRITLADGTIAGSAATMDVVVRNVVEWGLVPLAEGIRMASTVPARVLGLDGRKGRIAPGYDADLVAVDSDLQVVMTWVGGRMFYSQPEGRRG
jgi:N-acetylglucosamine-6-phosphate deacetylase